MRLPILMAVIAVAVLVIFNPEMPAFKEFVRTQTEQIVRDRTGDTAVGRLLSGVGSSLMGGMVDQLTERDNYFVFSIYTVDFDGPDEDTNEWRFLGIGGQFFELHRPEALQESETTVNE